ncbi:unnamed protein product [Caenorhabditis auriculariae]|uniref:Uncharacterized protein n=1 Tax=Caenorhabditis auriculariae TaxID=2777116 RepID=A0A8S1I0I8_9PELO|nr:unnamed protein product [Caenorhabditis auriculariae]
MSAPYPQRLEQVFEDFRNPNRELLEQENQHPQLPNHARGHENRAAGFNQRLPRMAVPQPGPQIELGSDVEVDGAGPRQGPVPMSLRNLLNMRIAQLQYNRRRGIQEDDSSEEEDRPHLLAPAPQRMLPVAREPDSQEEEEMGPVRAAPAPRVFDQGQP